MDPQLIAQLLLALGQAARTPAIQQESIAVWIELAGRLIQKGSEADAALRALEAQIRRMVAEQREPTEQEWESLRARSDAVHHAIQNWKPD